MEKERGEIRKAEGVNERGTSVSGECRYTDRQPTDDEDDETAVEERGELRRGKESNEEGLTILQCPPDCPAIQ